MHRVLFKWINMENVKNFFDSFKEFIWDIIGYFLPGSYILILLSVCINQKYFVTPSPVTITNDYLPFILVVVSYLLGHAAYGFGFLKEKIRGKRSYVSKIEATVATRKAFTLSKQLISKSLHAKGIIEDFSNTTVRDLRNIAMSFIPEQDQKIYTFTFRSDLSNQTANISISIGIFGLLCSLVSLIPSITLNVIKTDTAHVLLYICLIISYYFLRETRNRFYAISVGLPFSIYTAKAMQNEL